MTYVDENYWRNRYDSVLGNTGKQQPEKQQVNCTRTEREVLETAIAAAEARVAYDTFAAQAYARGCTPSEYNSLIAAARKHLATLPKPLPNFRVVASLAKSTGRITSSGGYTRTAAVNIASKWMAHGVYDSVAVEQVSA